MCKIKKAINEITKYTNVFSNVKKGITFIFGAGINFNLSSNAISWENFGIKSITTFLNKNKRLSKFESEKIAKSIYKILGSNKFLLSFNKNVELDIKILSHQKSKWFIDGYEKIINSFNGNVDTITMNYDKTLSNLMNMKPINTIKEGKIISSNSIVNHMHGIINDDKTISKESLFNLSSYIQYASVVEKQLIEYLRSNSKEKDQTYIIIGSSMQEEHILRTFKKIKSDQELRISNFILIGHLPNYPICVEKIIKIYKELNIEFLDINETGVYKNDFMSFWNKLSTSIHKNKFSPSKYYIDSNDISDSKLYYRIKDDIDSNKNLTIEKIKNKYSIRNIQNAPENLVRVFYWLKNDGLLNPEEFKKFFVSNYLKFEINFINLMDDESWLGVDKILDWMNSKIDNIQYFGSNYNDYAILEFILKEVKRDINDRSFYIKMKKRKNIMRLLLIRIIDDFYNVDSKIINYLLINSNITDLKGKRILNIHSNKYPKIGDTLYKLFSNDKKYEKYKSKENVDYIKEIMNLYIDAELYYVLLLNSNYFIKNYKLILDKIIANDEQSFIIHKLIYLIFTKSKKEKLQEYINYIKSLSNYPFNSFPRDIDILGHGGSGVPSMSQYDGEIIKSPKKTIDNDDQFLEIISNNNWNKHYSQSDILNYIKSNFSIELLENVANKEIWKYFFCANSQDIRVDRISDYYEIMKLINNNIEQELWPCFNFIPPFNIYNRMKELLSKKEKTNEWKNDVEFLVKLRFIMREYNDKHIWNKREIRELVRIDSKEVFKLLKERFEIKIYKLKNILSKNDYKFTSIDEYLIHFYFSGKTRKMNPFKMMKIGIDIYLERHFINSLLWNIRQIESKCRQNKVLSYFINKYSQHYSEMKNEIIYFKKLILWNNIVHKTRAKINDLEVSVYDVLSIMKELNENELKKYDSNISLQLGFVKKDFADRNIIYYIKSIKYKFLGKKTSDVLAKNILKWLNMLNNGMYIHLYEELINIAKHFKIYSDIKKIIKRKKLTYLGSV